jgi:hypothetical protein
MCWRTVIALVISCLLQVNCAPVGTTRRPEKPEINQLQRGDTNIIVNIKHAYLSLPEGSFDKQYYDKWLSNILTQAMQGNQEIPVFFNQSVNTKLSESTSNDQVDLDNKGVRFIFQYLTKFVSMFFNIQQNLEFHSDVDLESVTQSYKSPVSTTTEPTIKEKEKEEI